MEGQGEPVFSRAPLLCTGHQGRRRIQRPQPGIQPATTLPTKRKGTEQPSEQPELKKQRTSELSVIYVYPDLPLVTSILIQKKFLNNIHKSIIVKQLLDLGLRDIAPSLAHRQLQFAGRIAHFSRNWEVSETRAREHTAALIFLLENLGLVVNHPKSQTTPARNIEFLGFNIDSTTMEVKLPGEKIKKIRGEAKRLLSQTDNSVLALSRFLGKATEPCHSSDLTSSSILPKPPELLEGSTRQRRPGLTNGNPPERGKQSRVDLVANPPEDMEWAELSSPTPYVYDRNGRLHDRVGSVLPEGENRRGMVPNREGDAHQLLGATKCNFSSTVLCQRAEQHSDPTENGQYNSHLLHQPVRGHSLSPPEPTSKRTVVVVHEQEYYAESSPSSGEAQCNSRRGVQSDEGQNRLETMSTSFPNNQQSLGSIRSGPVRLQTLQPTSTVCELETRSGSDCLRCVQSELGTAEGVCKPSLEPNRQSPSPSEDSESRSGSSDSPVESTTMVSCTIEHASTDTNPLARCEGDIPTNTSLQQARHLSTTSRMEYLREKYKSQKISGEASKLLLASWRQKSSRLYDSLFTKWASWCSERNTDPISGDISEVVNFLAHLFEEG